MCLWPALSLFTALILCTLPCQTSRFSLFYSSHCRHGWKQWAIKSLMFSCLEISSAKQISPWLFNSASLTCLELAEYSQIPCRNKTWMAFIAVPNRIPAHLWMNLHEPSLSSLHVSLLVLETPTRRAYKALLTIFKGLPSPNFKVFFHFLISFKDLRTL